MAAALSSVGRIIVQLYHAFHPKKMVDEKGTKIDYMPPHQVQIQVQDQRRAPPDRLDLQHLAFNSVIFRFC